MQDFVLYLYPGNFLCYGALQKFEEIKYSIPESLVSHATALNNSILRLFSDMDFEYLYLSYTTSDSIFYRFKLNNSPYEFKWEVFVDSEINQIQSILHTYNNSIKEKSTYGYVEDIYSAILETIERYNIKKNEYVNIFYTFSEPENISFLITNVPSQISAY